MPVREIIPSIKVNNTSINNILIPTTSTPESQPQNHPPSLYELRLPASFLSLLVPALKATGFSTENTTIYRSNKSKPYAYPKPYTYTQLLRNQEPLRCLLHIDDRFLKDLQYFDNLVVMLQAFTHDQELIIFLDTPRFPPIQLRNLIESERNGKVRYITLRDLEDLSSL